MQHFCRRTQPRKFEYFKNNMGDRFLDRKNKNYENFLTGETTKKYQKVGHFLITIQKSLKQSWTQNGNFDENGCFFKLFCLNRFILFSKKITISLRKFRWPFSNKIIFITLIAHHTKNINTTIT